jgi:hypothetical protein
MAVKCFNLGFQNPFESSHRAYRSEVPSGPEAPVESLEAGSLKNIEDSLHAGRIEEHQAVYLRHLIQEAKADGSFDKNDAAAAAVFLRGSEERFALKQSIEKSAIEGEFLPTFLRRANTNTRILPGEAAKEFKEGQAYKVDFEQQGLPQALLDRGAQNVGLHEVVDPKVTAVEVNGITAIRGKDGKFFDTKGKRVWIKNQDSIKIVSRASGTVTAALDSENPSYVRALGGVTDSRSPQERQQAAAMEREVKAEGQYAKEKASALDAAMGRIEGQLGTLEKDSKVAVPTELQGLSKDQYKAQLLKLDHGKQVWTAAEELGGIANDSAANILAKVLDYKNVRFAEITHAVYGLLAGPNSVRKMYDEALKENEIVKFAAPIVQEEVDNVLDPNKHSDYKYKEQLLSDIAAGKQDYFASFRTYLHGKIREKMESAGKLTEENKEILKEYINGLLPPELRDSAYTGTDRVERLEQTLREMETLLSASYRLMEALSLLEVNEAATVGAETSSKSDDVVLMENVTASIFNPDDYGPSAKGQTITMETLGENYRAKGEDRMEYYVSNAAAYRELRDSQTTVLNGQEVTDLSLYCTRLTELRQAGWEKGQSLATAEKRGLFKKKEWVSKYPTMPTTPIQVTGEGDSRTIELTQEDKELIQLGMAWEQTEQYLLQQQEAESYLDFRLETVINSYPEPLRPLLSSVADVTDITPAELESLGNYMIQELDLGTAGVLLNQDKTVDKSADEENPETTVHNEVGFGYGRAMINWESPRGLKVALLLEGHGNVFEHQLGISGGVNVEKQLSERTRLGATAFGGIGLSNENPGALVGVGGVTVNFSVDLDKYKVWSLGVEAGAGFAGPLLYLNQGISVNRDLGQVAVKKSVEVREAQKAEMEAGFDSFVTSHQELFATMTPEQIAEFKSEFLYHYERDMQSMGIEAMKGFQFVGAGFKMVEVFVPGTGVMVIPVVWIRAGWKGREMVHYTEPKDLDLDAAAQARLAKDIAEQAGVATTQTRTVYTSGRLELTENGQKTLTESISDQITGSEQFEMLNRSLDRMGLSLERVGDALRLKVIKVDGVVNLYTDPESGVETYVEEGNVYINLDRSQPFYINRVDEYSPFQNGGFVHEVNLYITANKYISPRAIELSSKDQIRWEQSDRLGTRTGAVEVTQTTADRGSASYESKDAMEAAGVKVEDYFNEADTTARSEAHRLMQEALGVINSTTDTVDVEEMKGLATKVVETKSVSYAKITTDEVYYGSMIKEAENLAGRKLNREEIAVVTQEILVQSRAKAPETPEAQIAHILKWNQMALANNLRMQGVPDTEAASIAEKLMNYYADKVKAAVESGAAIETISLTNAGIVSTLIGPKATGQFGEMINDSGKLTLNLYGGERVTPRKLWEIFGSDAQGKREAELFLAAQQSMLAELDTTKPAEFIRTELGLAVLEAADLIWDADTAKALASLVQKNPQSTAAITNTAEGAAWTKYAMLVQNLRKNGTVKIGNMTLSTSLNQQMGFLETCQNFTTTWKESLSITVELEAVGAGGMARVQRYVEGRKGVRFTKAGLAFAYAQQTEEIPPEEEEEGEKVPPVMQGTEPRPIFGSHHGGPIRGDQGDAGADW